jgi:methyl-accepting chemotaxis protein
LSNPQKTSPIIIFFLELKTRFSEMKYQWMAGLGLIAVIPLLILISVTITTSKAGMAAKLPQVMENHLTNLGCSLELMMAGTENEMTVITATSSFQDDLARLENSSRNDNEIESLKESLAAWLEARRRKNPYISRIMVLGGPETSVNCLFNPENSYQNVIDSPWYAKIPAEKGKFVWIGSHPELDVDDNQSNHYAISCLTRLNPNFVFIVDLAAGPVSRLLATQLIPGNCGTYLMDPARRIAAGGSSGKTEDAAQQAILMEARKLGTGFGIDAKQKLRIRLVSPDASPSTKIAYYPLARSGWALASIITLAEYQTITQELVWLLILSGFILTFAVIGMGFFLTSRISDRLNRVINAFRRAESGNLTIPLNDASHDEIGAAAAGYQTMVNNFTPFITNLRQLTERQINLAEIMNSAFKIITVNVNKVLTNIREVAGSATQQSNETAGLGNFISEMAGKVDSITSNIKSIQEIGINTQSLTTTGIQSIENLNQNVSQTNTITINISDHLNVLNEETTQITQMISSIHEIADRNNILALNSLINAAKAGDSGRGFSVVANNVKRLAERSMIVTREISDFISGLQKRMVATAEAASNIGATVEAQNQAFNESIQIFNRINTVTNHLIERLVDIIQLVENMETNKAETLNSMDNISFRTRQMAVMMDEICNSLQSQLNTLTELLSLAKELKKVSHHLQQTIKDFKIA